MKRLDTKCSVKYLLIMLLFIVNVFNQQLFSTNIKGVVYEKLLSKPLPYATVRLLNAADSVMLKGTSTGEEGAFELREVKAGKYIISVSSIGYRVTYLPVEIPLKSEVVQLGRIQIEEDVILLSEAVVTAQMTEMVVKGDTLEFNAEAYKLPESAVMEDMLKRLPGVEITESGKIMVQGKQVKKIMIDGKNFFKGDPTVSSKNIPVEIMDKLQIINEKSELAQLTGIDDGEDEVVINISIKKGMKKGVMIHANAGAGMETEDIGKQDMRYDVNSVLMRFRDNSQLGTVVNGNNVNNQKFSGKGEENSPLSTRKALNPGINTSFSSGVNYAVEKSTRLKMSGDITYGFSDKDIDRLGFRQNMLIDSVTYLSDTTLTRNTTHDLKFTYQLEYKPVANWTIQFTPELLFAKGIVRTEGTGVLTTDDSISVNHNYKFNLTETKEINAGGMLTAVREFEKKGRKLSLSIDSRFTDAGADGENLSRFYIYRTGKERERIDQKIISSNSSMNTRIYAAFSEPLGDNNFLQATYWFRYNDRTTIKNSYVKDDADEYTIIDPRYSKSLDNTTITQQLAMSFRSVRDKATYLIGADLNPSYTNSRRFIYKGSADGSDSTVYRYPGYMVWNYAPNLSFTYNFSKIQLFRFDYRARTVSPTIFQLDPTEDLTNPNNIKRGNPNLLPTFVNILRMRYSDFDKKNQRTLLASVNAQYLINDIISKTIFEEKEEQIGTGIRTTEYLNESGSWNVQGIFMFNRPVGSMFQFNNYTQLVLRNDIGYSFMRGVGSERNTSLTTGLMENFGVSFRKNPVYIQLRGDYAMNKTVHSIVGRESQFTTGYGGLFTMQFNLPNTFSVSSELRYRVYTGFSDGFNRQEALWNIEISRMFFDNAGTVRLRMSDIFGQQLSIVRNITTNYVEDISYKTLSRYFMVYFAYRFNTFGGKGKFAKGDKNNQVLKQVKKSGGNIK